MTIRRVGLVVALVLCGAIAPHAQAAGDATSNAEQSAEQQKVKTLLQQMIQALGGDAWLNAPGYELIGRTSGFFQGKPTGAITDFWDYRQPPDKERVELGKKRQVYEIYVGDQGWEITYQGKRAVPKIEMDDYLRRRNHSVDAAARVWMKDPGALYLYGGQEQVERRLADKITILSSTNDNLTLDLDANSHLPVRRSFEWRDPLYKDKNVDGEEYDDYHKFNGISTPFSTARYHNGDMTNQRFLYNVVYGGAIPPEMFEVDAAVRKLKK
jgi:hypothetical protein